LTIQYIRGESVLSAQATRLGKAAMISLNKKATLNVAKNSPIKNLMEFFDAILLMVISRRLEKPDLTFDVSLI
jgi:hypothetical protein